MDFQEAYKQGCEALKAKNYARARELFREALKEKPDDVYTLNKLALIAKEEGQFDDVMELLEKSLMLKEHDLYTNYLLGNAYLEQGDVDRAIQTLEFTVSQNPNDKYALN